MSYIGSTPTNQSFIAGTDSFNGTGSATNFTLSRSVNSTNDIQVVVNNVVQYPPNYSVSGNTLTISPAPSSGTNNVYVRYLSTTLQSITVPGGSTVVGGFNVTGNLCVGTGLPVNLLTVQTAATGTTVGSNIIARFQSNASGRDATIQLSDNVANSSTISMLSGATVFQQNGVEQARITSAGLFQFNSGYGSVATAYGCRAWVNFNGTGTVAIRASGNVTSITDNGVGDYTVNFFSAMPDADYSVVISNTVTAGYAALVMGNIAANRTGAVIQAPTTTTARISFCVPATGAAADISYVCASIFR
jgi:hypothetical protein